MFMMTTNQLLLYLDQVQCWPCSSTTNHCEAENISECIQSYKTDHIEAIRCISPLYTVEEFPVSLKNNSSVVVIIILSSSVIISQPFVFSTITLDHSHLLQVCEVAS